MGFSFSGDFPSLQGFIDRIRKAPEVARVVAENMAEEALELVREGFESESDPDGRKWQALKYRSGKILQDTGRLRTGWHRKTVTGNGFTIGPAVKYATYHQHGTRRGLPARRMVPSNKRLPGKWKQRLTDTAREVLEAHFTS